MAPKEAKEIKKRWQEYTEELQKKKILMTQITQIMMVTHLEPDILECEVKWALGSITTNIARRRWNSSWAISNPKKWCCESAVLNMPENLENSVVATGLEKVSFHSSPKERQCQRMLKLPHNCAHLTCSKFSKLGFNSTWTVNFQMFKLVLQKAEEPEIKLPTSIGLSKRQESSRKNLFLLYWLCQSVWLCWSQ